VFGGELTDLDGITFRDLSRLDVVGIFPDYASAAMAWATKRHNAFIPPRAEPRRRAPVRSGLEQLVQMHDEVPWEDDEILHQDRGGQREPAARRGDRRLSRSPAGGVDHDEQFHQVIVGRERGRLDDEHVLAAHVLLQLGYARQDRRTSGRTPISAKLVANLITEAGADRVMTPGPAPRRRRRATPPSCRRGRAAP
jgi:hypothetical protein